MAHTSKPNPAHLKPSIWLQPGMLLVFGAALDTDSHHHHAIQLVLPMKNTPCHLDGRKVSQTFIINSQITHQLTMSAGWVLLVEPDTLLGQKLQSRLKGKDTITLPNFELASICGNSDPIEFLSPILSALSLENINSNIFASKIADHRIQQLLKEFDQCLKNDCKLLEDWHASAVASRLALSESRFLHLFREEMNIAWRPYLLWRRIICAIDAIIEGSTATNAAHIAGFSDSSHLSRTFRSQFGLTIRQAQKLLNQY